MGFKKNRGMDTSNLKKAPAGLISTKHSAREESQGAQGAGRADGGSLRAHNWSAQVGHVLGAANVGAKPDADDQRTHEMKKDVGHGSVLSEAARGGIETVGGSLKPAAGDLGGHSREAQAEAGEMSEVAHHGSGLLLSLIGRAFGADKLGRQVFSRDCSLHSIPDGVGQLIRPLADSRTGNANRFGCCCHRPAEQFYGLRFLHVAQISMLTT